MNGDNNQINENIISCSAEEEEKDEEAVEAFVSGVLNSLEFESSSNNGGENSSLNDNDDQEVDLECSPLGLKLSRTPSFVNLFTSKLQSLADHKFEKNDSNQCTDTFNDKKFERIDSVRHTDTSTTLKYQKLKASNFPVKCVQIGAWQRISRYDGELVTKFYYAKKKIIWEFIDGPLKCKIEILWSAISAIRAVLNDNQLGILAIELNNPPTFFKEINPQPRKHSLWKPCIDFTGNHASISRRHRGCFDAKVLDRHFEKLLECDPRLFELNQRPCPSSQSPFFNSFQVRVPRNIPHNSGPPVSPVVQYSNPNRTRIISGGVSPMVQYPNPTERAREVSPMELYCPNPNLATTATGDISSMVRRPYPTRITSGEFSPMVQCLNPNLTRIANGGILPVVQYRRPNLTRVADRVVLQMAQHRRPNPTRIASRGVSAIGQYPNPYPPYPNNPTVETVVRATPNQASTRPPLVDTNGRGINGQVVTHKPPEM